MRKASKRFQDKAMGKLSFLPVSVQRFLHLAAIDVFRRLPRHIRRLNRLLSHLVNTVETPLYTCRRVINEYVIIFRIVRRTKSYLDGIVQTSSVMITSNYNRKIVPDDIVFTVDAMVKSVEWEIVAAHSDLFTRHAEFTEVR